MATPEDVKEVGFFTRMRGDFTYAGLLLFCALISYLLRRYGSLEVRRRFDGIIGLAITLVMARGMVVYSLLCVLAHLALYRYVREPRLLANLSFYGTFAYLALLRVIHFFGFPPLVFVTNAIQLIMTLRVIGLSYEIADARAAATDTSKDDAPGTARRHISEPTAYEAFTYLYSFTGLFTGPYYTYRTYADALSSPHLTKVPIRGMIMEKVRTLAWSVPILLFMSWLDPVEALRQERITEYRVVTLLVMSAMAFVYLRMRIYSAWMVAETICITAGIGIYPSASRPEPGHGPRDLAALKSAVDDENTEYNAATIDNLDIPHVENSDGFRSGMRAWNRTVQFWLANFVYRRTNRAIRMPYTMFISAFWHGIHPGYFLSFLTIPLCTAAEDTLFRVVQSESKTGQRSLTFRLIWGFIRMRGFESMACGFLLLTWTDTVRLWSSLYWWLHVVSISVIVLGQFYLQVFLKPKSTKEGTDGAKME
ncbi:Membrane bound O-acyl transferase [Aphelenchoides avenae]|nr:Membrane bound O-acyl transferase [Aphelenchus avenae]